MIERYFACTVPLAVEGLSSNDEVDASQRRNAQRMADVIDAAVALFDPAPKLFVFPVLGFVGAGRRPPGLERDHVAMTLPSPRIQPLLDACRRHGVYAATSTPERIDSLPGHVFHTGFIVGPEGIVLKSPKAQAYSASGVTPLRLLKDEYEAQFGPESIYPVVDTPIGRLACLVEKEIQIPETCRVLANRGADLVIQLSAEGKGALELFPTHQVRSAAAYANSVYVLAASFSRILFPMADGGWDEDAWGGIGQIVGPDGQVIAEVTSSAGGIAAAWIDIEDRRRIAAETAPEKTPVAELFPWAPGARPAAEIALDPAQLPRGSSTASAS